MSRYKDHPIYGVAVPAPEHRRYSRGLVFDRDLNQTIEIKRIESNPRTFKTKAEIEALRGRPIRLGQNDHIDGVTLTNDANEQVHVRTCMNTTQQSRQDFTPTRTLTSRCPPFSSINVACLIPSKPRPLLSAASLPISKSALLILSS